MKKQELVVNQNHVEIIELIKEKNVMVVKDVMNVNVKKVGSHEKKLIVHLILLVFEDI